MVMRDTRAAQRRAHKEKAMSKTNGHAPASAAAPASGFDSSTIRSAQALKAAFDEVQIVNDDEAIDPEPVPVTVREYVSYEEQTSDGRTIKRNRIVTRRTLIETYVPWECWVAHQRAREALVKATADQVLEWMGSQVLLIWNLTEPDMTLETLRRALTMEEMVSLFVRFFGENYRQLAGRVLSAASISSASRNSQPPAEQTPPSPPTP